jgi:hypothetical protein
MIQADNQPLTSVSVKNQATGLAHVKNRLSFAAPFTPRDGMFSEILSYRFFFGEGLAA